MKILVCYFSYSGNTKRVAESIVNGLIPEEVTILPVKKVNPTEFIMYDLIFLGSGVYSGKVGRDLKTCLVKAKNLPAYFALFYTHAMEGQENCFTQVEEIIKANQSQILGTFECRGDSTPSVDQAEAAFTLLAEEDSMDPEERKRYINRLKGAPFDQDLLDAKLFAQNILSKIRNEKKVLKI